MFPVRILLSMKLLIQGQNTDILTHIPLRSLVASNGRRLRPVRPNTGSQTASIDGDINKLADNNSR